MLVAISSIPFNVSLRHRGDLTLDITGRANGNGGTIRTALRALRCMPLLDIRRRSLLPLAFAIYATTTQPHVPQHCREAVARRASTSATRACECRNDAAARHVAHALASDADEGHEGCARRAGGARGRRRPHRAGPHRARRNGHPPPRRPLPAPWIRPPASSIRGGSATGRPEWARPQPIRTPRPAPTPSR